jgi:dUTP pyrophosphatase
MVQVRFIILPHGEGLPAPAYQSELAAGLDLVAAIEEGKTVTLERGSRMLIPAGIAIEIPRGYEGQVRPRSGLALRHGVTVLNSPGTIDADYRGEVKVLLINLGNEPFTIRRGERIAQLIVCAVAQATLELSHQLDATGRGSGGFGSTGS